MNQLQQIVRLALAEDVGTGDITTASTVLPGISASGRFVARAPGILSGLEPAAQVFYEVDQRIDFVPALQDGDQFAAGDLLATVAGPARGILTAERVSLNFMQRLSGVATVTGRYVAEVAGTGARIIDTRKTTPGMRLLEKAAIRHGGGHNHRVGLSDGVLIKDNHLAAIGGSDAISRAIQAARDAAPHTLRVEVEVTTLEELEQALDAGADVIMLDNMPVPTMAEAVQRASGRALLEASGGITFDSVREIAQTGVDLISIGALTHSALAIDISLDFELHQR